MPPPPPRSEHPAIALHLCNLVEPFLTAVMVKEVASKEEFDEIIGVGE